jgi:hypothetical protein
MIPIFAVEAGGARVIKFDDPGVTKDLCALDGTGGSTFTPSFTVNQVRGGPDLGWSKLRRIALNLESASACTVVVTPLVDGRLSGSPITRTVALGGVGVVTVPCAESGTGHAWKVEVTSYTAPVAFSNSEAFVLGKRVSRA